MCGSICAARIWRRLSFGTDSYSLSPASCGYVFDQHIAGTSWPGSLQQQLVFGIRFKKRVKEGRWWSIFASFGKPTTSHQKPQKHSVRNEHSSKFQRALLPLRPPLPCFGHEGVCNMLSGVLPAGIERPPAPRTVGQGNSRLSSSTIMGTTCSRTCIPLPKSRKHSSSPGICENHPPPDSSTEVEGTTFSRPAPGEQYLSTRVGDNPPLSGSTAMATTRPWMCRRPAPTHEERHPENTAGERRDAAESIVVCPRQTATS